MHGQPQGNQQAMNLKRYLPTREDLRQTKSLGFLAGVMFEPELWHITRHSLSWAVLIGSICCFLPIPFQMIPCIIICVWIKCNVPVALVIVWASNPITMPAIMYFCYQLGNAILDLDPQFDSLVLSFEWLVSQVAVIWQPLLVGSLVSGFTVGITGFLLVHLYWHLWNKTHG